MANINGNEIYFGIVGQVETNGDIDYSKYKRLEYIKTTGTQGIVTEYIPSYTDVLKFQIKLNGDDISSSDNERRLISSGSSFKYSNVMHDYNGGQMDIYLGYNWTSEYDSRINLKYTNTWTAYECTLKIKRGDSSCGNVQNYTDAPITNTDPDEPLSIFGMKSGSTFYPFKTRDECYFYGGEIFASNGISKCRLVPVERIADGEVGLFDTVAKKFFTNAGTGTFEKGYI